MLEKKLSVSRENLSIGIPTRLGSNVKLKTNVIPITTASSNIHADNHSELGQFYESDFDRADVVPIDR